MLGYASAIRSGKSHGEALKTASVQMAKSGGTSLVVGVGTQQLLRTTVGRSMASAATSLPEPYLMLQQQLKSGRLLSRRRLRR